MSQRECYDVFKARNRNTNEIVTIMRVKSGFNTEALESRFNDLKTCDSMFIVKYKDLVKKDGVLWVVMKERGEEQVVMEYGCYIPVESVIQRKAYMNQHELREFACCYLLGLRQLYGKGLVNKVVDS